MTIYLTQIMSLQRKRHLSAIWDKVIWKGMWLAKKKKLKKRQEGVGVFKNGEAGDAIAHAHNYKQCSSNLSLANH